MRLCFLSMLALLVALPAAAQPRAAVSGTVTDAATGAPLAGASVSAPDLGRGTAADSLGRFSLPLPPGRVRLVVSHAGFARFDTALDVGSDRTLDVALEPSTRLGEVVVDAAALRDARPERAVEMGRIALSGNEIETLPALLGEVDILKAVQTLPGVRGGAEGTAGLYVRGGSPDQTLVRLDGVAVYNPSHLLGFLSTFDASAVGRAELTKGAQSARAGGRLGSVLDVGLRPGDRERHRAEAQVGVLAARALVEGPVPGADATYLVSARRSHVQTLLRPFVAQANRRAARTNRTQVEPEISFLDATARLDARVGARTSAALSLYAGGDRFSFEAVDPGETCAGGMCVATGAADVYGGRLDWANRAGALRAAHALSPRAVAALTLAAGDYDLDVGVDAEADRGGANSRSQRARYRSAVRDRGARLDLDLAAGGHALRIGVSATGQRFTPGALAVAGADAARGTAVDTLLGSARARGLDAAVYAEDEVRRGRWGLSAGLRVAAFATEGRAFPSVEPRLSVSFALAERLAVKLSAARAQQPLHLLTTGSGLGLPADLWVPATRRARPQTGEQVAVGLAGSTGRTAWTLDGYARSMRGLVAYRDGAGFTSAFRDWQDLVVAGEGRALGLEAFVQHRGPRLSGWAGYTLARSERRFDALDGGAWFPFRYDRRHDATAVATLRLSRRLDVSALATAASGDAVTLPVATFEGTTFIARSVDTWIRSDAQAAEETAFGPRNRTRLPATHRLDVSATFFFRRAPRAHALTLSVYNATNRKNPYLTTLSTRTDPQTGETRQQLVGIALFPILPTISYQIAL